MSDSRPVFRPVTPSRQRHERRGATRHDVDLGGTVRIGNSSYLVTVSDLSLTGALITTEIVFPAGALISLAIDGLGAVEAQVAHLGRGYCGVQFVAPERYRARLSTWLRLADAPNLSP